MLQVRDLSTSILKRASFTLSAGECIAVTGSSGAGKTLLLRAIADLDPNDGVASLDGRDRSTIAAPEWRRLVGYVPAEPGWWAETVGEHFREWQAAFAYLRKLGFSEGTRTWPIARMSTGERLRLALIRALMVQPKVLLLDEPTAALDAASEAAVESLISCRLEAGVAVLWITHDEAASQSHRAPTTCGRGWSRLREHRGMPSYIALSYWDLAVASVLVLIDAALSIIFGLRIHRSLLVAAIRMTVQLALVGLVLTFLFAVVSPLWTGLAALGMILFAGLEVTQRQERRLSG
jgi:UDP-glucose/iron transport system ATP-binding protein